MFGLFPSGGQVKTKKTIAGRIDRQWVDKFL